MTVTISGWRRHEWRLFGPGDGKAARDWIGQAIAAHPCPADPGDAALATAEMFSNAVTHGPPGGAVLVSYVLWDEGARIAVCDGGGPTAPVLREDAGLAESGRGRRPAAVGCRNERGTVAHASARSGRPDSP